MTIVSNEAQRSCVQAESLGTRLAVRSEAQSMLLNSRDGSSEQVSVG